MYRRLDGTRIVDTLERALYVQDSQDPVVLDAVNDVETLTTGLSSKIWQKIMILDTLETSRRLT